MAGEIAHVVYAARLLSYLKNDISHASYWAGALFPNIRKVDAISRHPTHIQSITLATLRGADDFDTGMRVHAWIDETQHLYMRRERISETLPAHPLVPHALELLEDELLYDAYDNWDAVKRALLIIHSGEVAYVHERPHIETWHDTLREYFSEKPNPDSRITYCQAVGVSRTVAEETNALLERLRANPASHRALQGYLHEVEHMLT